MPRMTNYLHVSDKWDTYAIDNEKGVEYAALDLLVERLAQDFWYDNWDDGNPNHQWKDRAQAIVDAQDADAALDFLLERSDHEYEYVEVR